MWFIRKNCLLCYDLKIIYLAITVICLSFGMMEYSHGSNLTTLGNGSAPIYVSNNDNGRFDFSNDGLADYYVKAHYTGNQHQQYKVDYKIQDACVDGNTFDTATIKIGFTTLASHNDRIWLVDDIKVWNPWFKSKQNDDNGVIDLVYLPPATTPVPYPSDGNGQDVIQGTKKHGSFTHNDSISELDGQPGWEGTIFFKVPKGEYYLWTIHPADGSVGCETLAGLGIPIRITE